MGIRNKRPTSTEAPLYGRWKYLYIGVPLYDGILIYADNNSAWRHIVPSMTRAADILVGSLHTCDTRYYNNYFMVDLKNVLVLSGPFSRVPDGEIKPLSNRELLQLLIGK